jgi:hypothetical protein
MIQYLKKLFYKLKGKKINTNNKINPNMHIEEYLDNYLILPTPEYAILLNGKWGSGKTYFIKKFIEDRKNDNFKFIKISLFGLNSTNAIDEEIFQNLHPILGSKYAKTTGNILKSALKLGVNLDVNNDNKKDATASIDLSKVNPLDYFSDKKDTKEIVFIFDDLERTEINLKKILGYINYLVEQSNFKVIILTNEEKINEDEYKEFKEKIIGKTFQIQHDFNDILTSFINEKTNNSKEILIENIEKIKDIYEQAGYNNLRHISQILFDFEYFINKIDKDYINNKEFISILINNFFALSIELKSDNLKKDELLKRDVITFDYLNKDKEKTNIQIIYDKYNIKTTPLFDGKIWVQILLENSIKDDELNALINKLTFFLKEQENQEPSWVKLWHYRQLEDEEFKTNLSDVIEKFKNCKYDIPAHYTHTVGLLMFFSKNGLCKLSIEEINENIDSCIEEQYKNSPDWKNKLLNSRFNGTGLGYINDADEDFQEALSIITKKNEEIYRDEEKQKQEDLLNKFLESIIKFNEDFIIKYLLEDNTSVPILNNLDSNEFCEILITLKNKDITRLSEIFHSRYSDNVSSYNRLLYCSLTDELVFWENIKKYLDDNIKTVDKTLKTILLENFNTYLVSSVIEKLKTCD